MTTVRTLPGGIYVQGVLDVYCVSLMGGPNLVAFTSDDKGRLYYRIFTMAVVKGNAFLVPVCIAGSTAKHDDIVTWGFKYRRVGSPYQLHSKASLALNQQKKHPAF